jgi:DNA excision repair protein ERCC-2
MPSTVSCPVCGHQNSIGEHEENRLCSNCGAPLPTQVQRRSWRTLFPYEPYSQQVDFMDDVERIVGAGGVLIAEACNGFGKTSSALSSLLALGRPILYATRTHEQVRQVLTEIIAINEKSGEGFTAVSLASRQHLCLNPNVQDLPQRELLEACRALKEGDGCEYRSDIQEVPQGLPPVLLPRKLIAVGEQRNLCPYYLARRIAQRSRVVVAPYAYVFDTIVRASVGLSLSERVLVLDEGHNLDKVGQESLSDTLSERSLNIAEEELRSVGTPATLVKRLANHLREQTSDEPLLQSAEALERELELVLGVDLHSFVDRYSEAVKAIRTRKMRQGDPPVCYLNGVLSFLSLVASSRKSQYIAVYQRSPYGAAALEYRCLDPSLAVQPVIEEASGSLIMSGTLSPMNLFAEIMGLSSAEKRAYPPIQNSKNIRMVIDTTVTTRFKERSDEMILQVGRSIVTDIAGVPNGVLLFFTQRQFMSRCLDIWGTNGVIEVHGGRLHLGGKPLFVEGHNADENREVVERYKEEAGGSSGAVLSCVFRGRNAEGSNFPDEEARGIFLVGVPYANYREPLVRAQISYFNGLKQGLGQRWYLMDAFRSANQALGRGIRSRDDWCHYWLLDKRYAEHVSLLSKWALGEKPEIRE